MSETNDVISAFREYWNDETLVQDLRCLGHAIDKLAELNGIKGNTDSYRKIKSIAGALKTSTLETKKVETKPTKKYSCAVVPTTLVNVDRYNLGEAIRESYEKHGKDSWCSVADEVISKMQQQTWKSGDSTNFRSTLREEECLP